MQALIQIGRAVPKQPASFEGAHHLWTLYPFFFFLNDFSE